MFRIWARGWAAVTVGTLAIAGLVAGYAYGDPWGYVGVVLAPVAAVVAVAAVVQSRRTLTVAFAALALTPLALTILIFYLASKST
jgi:hypothetical protein